MSKELEKRIAELEVINEDFQKQITSLTNEVNQLNGSLSEERGLSRLYKKQLDEVNVSSGGAADLELRKQYDDMNVLLSQIEQSLIIPACKYGSQLINWKAYYDAAILKRLEILNDPKIPPINKIDYRQSIILFENMEQLKKIMNEAFAEDKAKYGLI